MKIKYFVCLFVLILARTIYATEQINSIPTKQSKVILITGASRGIGWESANYLALQGHKVYASVRYLAAFMPTKNALPPSLHVIELDVTDSLSVTRAVELILQNEGRLDVLINNAGCAVFGTLETISIEQARQTFEVNFFGTMRLMQEALPVMRKQGSGLIINVSSTAGVRPTPCWDVYAASKFAIEGMSEAVAAMMRQWNINVVLLEPGATATDFIYKSTEIGQRDTDQHTVFDSFVSNALKWMQDKLADGQNPLEIAKIIACIIAEENPKLRYQTTFKGTQTVAFRHCDPTGEKTVAEQILLIKDLWKGPLEP